MYEKRSQQLFRGELPILVGSLKSNPPYDAGQPLSTPKWDPFTLEQEEVAHRAEGERLRLARLEKECVQKEATERAEASRLAALYRARQEELSKKM